MTKTPYRVLLPVEHDGTRVEPGGRLELSPEHAGPLLELGAVAPAKDENHREARILEAIRGLIEQDPEKAEADLWTKDGRPEVKALRDATGLTDLSASERNAAHAAYKSAHQFAQPETPGETE